MILQPLKANAGRRETSTVKFVDPPVKGWNARDDLSAMDKDEAIILENLVPSDTGVFLRQGYTSWVTGLGSDIRSLMEWSGASASKLFAATGTAIYDVTSTGAVGAAVVTPLTVGHWQHVMFSTAGGTFLVLANGADAVRNYDGTTWTSPAITGVTPANLVNVTSHMSRLWFCEENSMKAWYLPTLSIAGAATSIDFGGLSKLGGKLMAIASWTRDSGAGIEDLAVFVTSAGEVHIYGGTDPASSTTWKRVGTYKIPEPVGRRCMIKVGGDIGIITTQGVIPLTGVLSKAESVQGKVAITDNIRNEFSSAYVANPTSKMWQCIEYPVQKLVILNAPIVDGTTARQFVMNANTGAWCKFTGLNANVFSLKGTDMYFGGINGTVYKMGGTTDSGVAIDGLLVSAFQNFGTPSTKSFRRIRPQFFGPSGYKPLIALKLDYSDEFALYAAASFNAPGVAWDTPDWDASPWASPAQSSALWQGIAGEGFVAAVVVKLSSVETMTYNGAKILYETGDHL